MAIFDLIPKFTRNLPLVRQLYEFAQSDDSETRLEKLKELNAWAGQKAFAEYRDIKLSNFKGFAGRLLADWPFLEAHLVATRHFGVLPVPNGTQVARAAYVNLQSNLLLRLKRAHPGLGLASKDPTLGLTGLEIAQTWSLLNSFGRLWGTHATERAVLFELKRSKPLRRAFFEQYGELKPTALRLWPDTDLYTVNRLLGLLRVVRLPRSELRERVLKVYVAYLLPEGAPALRKVRHAYEISRRLAYLQLHSVIGLQPEVNPDLVDSTIARFAEDPNIEFVSGFHEHSPHERLIDSINDFHFRTYFTSSAAAAEVLTHLREFKEWWRQRSNSLDALNDLYVRPPDWCVHQPVGDLFAALRLELPLHGSGWHAETESWWQAGVPWAPDATFFISHEPRGRTLLCDVFAGRVLSQAEMHHILKQLGRHSARTLSEERHRVVTGKALTRVFLYLLEHLLGRAWRLHVRPVEGSVDMGYALADQSRARLQGRLRSFAVGAASLRSAELTACADFLGRFEGADDGIWAAHVGQMFVVDANDGSQEAEIDGLVLSSTPDQLMLHVLEVKKGSHAGSIGQLTRIAAHLGLKGPTTLYESRSGSHRIRSFPVEWAPARLPAV